MAKVRYQIEKHMDKLDKDGNLIKVDIVLLNNSISEVFETSKIEKAEEMVRILSINSDSGHKYLVRKVE